MVTACESWLVPLLNVRRYSCLFINVDSLCGVLIWSAFRSVSCRLSGRTERAQRSGALQLSGRSAWRRGGFPQRATGSPSQDQEQKGTPRFTALALSHPSAISLSLFLNFFFNLSFLCAWIFSSSLSVIHVAWRPFVLFLFFFFFFYLFSFIYFILLGTVK